MLDDKKKPVDESLLFGGISEGWIEANEANDSRYMYDFDMQAGAVGAVYM